MLPVYMKDETNINMDNKDHIVLSWDTLGTTGPNLQMSSPTLTKEKIACVDEKEYHNYDNNCEDSSEHVQSSEYVNYYDNESYVEQLKTEFPEDVLPQSDCGVDSKMHSENEELLKFIAKAELNNENIEDGLSLNIKEQNDYNEYQFIVKMEGLEEQEDTQCKFSHKTLKNGCNLLQNSNKHVRVQISAPLDNGITEVNQCQYCGKGFDDYNNMLVHISNEHKQKNSKCDICDKRFKSIGNLKRHILTVHKLDKPPEPVTENCVNCHVEFQHKCPLNDHSKLCCSNKEDGEDGSENKVTRNITNYDYGTILESSCGKQYRSPIHLRKHQKLRHRRKIPKTNNDRFQCDSCKNVFKTKPGIVRHIKLVHFDYGRKFECWCGKQFRSPIHLREHETRIHKRNVKNTNDDKFQCDYCKNFFKGKSSVVRHIKAVHFDYGKRFACSCGKQFRSPIHLRKHEKNIHRHNVQNTNNSKFQCDYCKFFFKTKSNLLLHIQRIHCDYGREFECWCGKQFRTPMHLQSHENQTHRRKVQNTNNSKFQYDHCKISFKIKGNSAKHIKAMHFDYGRKFECWCGKQFPSPKHLKNHENQTHRRKVQNTNNSKFQCDHCKISCKTKGNLVRHIKAMHFEYGRKFQCWCGKQFRSPMHLQNHENQAHRRKVQNTNNSKFQCDNCNISYKIKGNLVRHIKAVHFDYGRKFQCWCGKQFRSPMHLQNHENQTHRRKVQNSNNSKFQCDHCKNSFKTKGHLTRHIKAMHFDYGRKFECWCGKQFRTPLHLRNHERQTHRQYVRNTINSQFQCDYCKKFYKGKLNLVTHIKLVHFDYGRKFECYCGKQFRSPIHLYQHEKYGHNVKKIKKTVNSNAIIVKKIFKRNLI